ncbi:H17B6 dehydrogenase, partial [Chauna torquata]|nr:H17B6 dehydrogenase [Chauna torquata]
RRELRNFGVKVSIIEPGCFQTSILDSAEGRQSITQAWDRAPDEVKREYGQQYFNTCDNFLRFVATASPKLSLVTKAMEHALTAEHPRTRYGCGLDARFFYIPLSYLPSAWTDRL